VNGCFLKLLHQVSGWQINQLIRKGKNVIIPVVHQSIYKTAG
jgi:hypothetical protein